MRGLIQKLVQFKLFSFQMFSILLLSFIFGTWFGNFLNYKWNNIFPYLLFITSLLIFTAYINKIFKNNILTVASWIIIFLIFGVANYCWQNSIYFYDCEVKGSINGEIINNPVSNYKNQEVIINSKLCGRNSHILVKASRMPKLQYGDLVMVLGKIEKPGMIEDFDYARYLMPKKVSWVILNPQKVEKMANNITPTKKILRSIYSVKYRIETILSKLFHQPYRALSIGLITGAKQSMPDELNDNLNISGLTHIIALSGFNVTIIIVALTAVLANIMHRKKIFIIGSILITIFIIMTGASASVVRAGIFSLLILYGKTIGRKAYQTNILLMAAVLMLVFNPFLLVNDIGFQLSFLAFCGIVYLSKIIEYLFSKSIINKLPTWLQSPLLETLSAQILVFPLIAFSFGRVSLISPLSNIAVLWIIPLAMLMSFIAGVVGLIYLPLGKVVAFIAYPVLIYIIEVINISAKLPLASLALQKYNYIVVSLLYLVIGVLIILVKRKMYKWQRNLYE